MSYRRHSLVQPWCSREDNLQRTGHKSIDGLRVYERPSEVQHLEACKALSDITITINTTAACLSSNPFPFLASGAAQIVFNGPITINYGSPHAPEFSLSQKEWEEFERFD